VAGQWAALLTSGGSLPWVGVSFCLFRLLDIVKPGPIGFIDRMSARTLRGKAWVIMADDLVAGLVTSGIIALLQGLL
jgi:phosphatidylglycerophosphatase A